MTDGLESIAEISGRLEQFLNQRANNTEPQPSSEPQEVECPKCAGTGYVRGAVGMRECACTAERRVIARLPLRFKRASLVDFPRGVQEFVLGWLSDPRDGLLLTGAVGTGKTHLLAAMARTLLLTSQEAVFRRCAELYASLRVCYRENRSEEAVLSEYTAPRWLFLDDLGAGSLSDFERRNALEILDQRFNRNLPTAISTNWSLEQIAERMDDRIASRLSALHAMELSGEDKRSAPRILAPRRGPNSDQLRTGADSRPTAA
jgi:hypothetical protein